MEAVRKEAFQQLSHQMYIKKNSIDHGHFHIPPNSTLQTILMSIYDVSHVRK
jgi:hypothetical protein